MKTWKRADGAKVTLSEYDEFYGPRFLRVYGPDGLIINQAFEYWERSKAKQAAKDMAALLQAEEASDAELESAS